MTLLEEIKEMDRDGFIADIQRFCQVSKVGHSRFITEPSASQRVIELML